MTYYDDDTCCFGLKCPKYVATEHKEHKEPEKPKPKPEEAAPAEDICKDNSCMGPGACLLFDKEGKVQECKISAAKYFEAAECNDDWGVFCEKDPPVYPGGWSNGKKPVVATETAD